MKNNSKRVAPVILKEGNYLLWSKTLKTILCNHGLWKHIKDGGTHNSTAKHCEEGCEETTYEKKTSWLLEEKMALLTIQMTLDATLLEAYSHCETAKELWEDLSKAFDNSSSLLRIFEVKKEIKDLSQGNSEFKELFEKHMYLQTELEILRPDSLDPSVLKKRREEDKVFELLMTLHPVYKDLIKNILKMNKLPTLEEVYSQVQKEQEAHGLFKRKEGLHLTNNGSYKPVEKKEWKCEHCKKKGHTKERCWVLNPHLKPSKFR